MKSHILILFTLIALLLSGCMNSESKEGIRQLGGVIDTVGKIGSVNVEQPNNAKETAVLEYNEDGVKIDMNQGDQLELEIGNKKINYTPQGKATVEVNSIQSEASTGSSHKDIVGQLKVFLDNIKIILWVGMGFIVTGGVFAFILKDMKSGFICGSIGTSMLIGYAVLPQIYAHWVLVLTGLVIIIPLFWFINMRRNERLLKASVATHERKKLVNPEEAKKDSAEFKQKVNPKDLKHIKKLKPDNE